MSLNILANHFKEFVKSTAWYVLAINEIKQKYRRTLAGPNWISITTMVQIACLGPLYSALFNQPIESYILYISIGLIIWGIILNSLNDFSILYINSEGYILNSHFNIFTFLSKTTLKHVIIYCHSAPILIALFLYYDVNLVYVLIAHVSLVVTFFALMMIGSLLALVSLRYRDVPVMVQNILMMFFFLTPIIWKARMFGENSIFVKLNPFFHMIEVFRAPILYQTIPQQSINFLILLSVVLFFLNAVLYSRFISKIGNWL